MPKKIATVSYFRNYENVKGSSKELERRLRNKDLSKSGAAETSGLLRKKGATLAPSCLEFSSGLKTGDLDR
jgi:hypothetical protein